MAADPSVNRSLIGSLSLKPPLSKAAALSVPLLPAFQSYAPSRPLVETMEPRYYLNVTSLQNLGNADLISVPYFDWMIANATSNDLDAYFNRAIPATVEKLNNVNKTAFLQDQVTGLDTIQYVIYSTLATDGMPYGGIFFSKIDSATKNYSYTLHFGSDIRITRGASLSFPSSGERQVLMQSQLSNAFCK